jgi:galactokinase
VNIKELLAVHQAAGTQAAAQIFQAPGRVNLLGEHTDYSGGFCMPVAINFGTLVAASPRSDNIVRIYSVDFGATIECDLGALPSDARGHWSAYFIGVIWSLQEDGIPIHGADLTVTGNVPRGAGLSSSASVEVATATALLGLSGIALPGAHLARLCQRAENDYVGAPCGIMDQFVSACGREGNALVLDTRSLEYTLAPFPPTLRLVICNSMVKHSTEEAYATRRREVEEGTRVLASYRPAIASLRDVTMEDLNNCRRSLPENVFRRCRHIITDSQRVLDGLSYLEAGEIAEFGRLMNEAHTSYWEDFEASCLECDLLVTLAQREAGCYGARLTGGGFGGCTVNLVEEAYSDRFVENMKRSYREMTSVDPDIYICRITAGAGQLQGY